MISFVYYTPLLAETEVTIWSQRLTHASVARQSVRSWEHNGE